MTGYQSKKAAASAKTIDEVNWVDHEPDGRRAAQEPAQEKYTYGTPLLDAMTKNYVSAQEPVAYGMWDTMIGYGGRMMSVRLDKGQDGCTVPLYAASPQRPWVEPTSNEWFEWWRVSQVADATEAEIDFADFLIIAQAVVAKLKELNNG